MSINQPVKDARLHIHSDTGTADLYLDDQPFAWPLGGEVSHYAEPGCMGILTLRIFADNFTVESDRLSS